jgi:hypothetical protein
VQRTIEGVRAKLAFAQGNDLIEARKEADEGLARLGEALGALESTGAEVDVRLGALDEAARAGDLGQDLRRTRDEVGAKLELGLRIHAAAEAAAFRLACNVPVRTLLRKRPKDLVPGLEGAEGLDEAKTLLDFAGTMIDLFLHEAGRARAELDEVAKRRPLGMEGEDPWEQAVRDVEAVAAAYRALLDRIGVSALRLSARAGMDAVASAAGDVSSKARASGIPAQDLAALVDEVTRAESAVRMATPAELDGRALSEALARGAAALGEGGDGAKLDELLRALRELG